MTWSVNTVQYGGDTPDVTADAKIVVLERRRRNAVGEDGTLQGIQQGEVTFLVTYTYGGHGRYDLQPGHPADHCRGGGGAPPPFPAWIMPLLLVIVIAAVVLIAAIVVVAVVMARRKRASWDNGFLRAVDRRPKKGSIGISN